SPCAFFSFFTAPPTTHLYTLSLHDALPISATDSADPLRSPLGSPEPAPPGRTPPPAARSTGSRRAEQRADIRRHSHDRREREQGDRKSTRLNSSHVKISYAVFCLKKKKQQE